MCKLATFCKLCFKKNQKCWCVHCMCRLFQNAWVGTLGKCDDGLIRRCMCRAVFISNHYEFVDIWCIFVCWKSNYRFDCFSIKFIVGMNCAYWCIMIIAIDSGKVPTQNELDSRYWISICSVRKSKIIAIKREIFEQFSIRKGWSHCCVGYWIFKVD